MMAMGEYDELPGEQNPFTDGIDEFDSEYRNAFARAYLEAGLRPSVLWRKVTGTK